MLLMLLSADFYSRRKATAGKVRDLESIRKGSKEFKVMPTSNANANLKASIQVTCPSNCVLYIYVCSRVECESLTQIQ